MLDTFCVVLYEPCRAGEFCYTLNFGRDVGYCINSPLKVVNRHSEFRIARSEFLKICIGDVFMGLVS